MLSRLKALFGGYERASRQVVGMNRRNALYVYTHNARRDYPLVDDKIACKERLERHGVPTAPTLDICEGLFDIPRTLERLARESNFVVKPANSSGGKGIVVLGERAAGDDDASGSGGWRTAAGAVYGEEQLRSHLGAIAFGAFGRKLSDRALVERKLVQHSFFSELWEHGVSDLRLILLRGNPLMAMLRVPTRRSGGRANLHQGGVGVAIDVATGLAKRASTKGVEVSDHPDTGRSLLGGHVPAWDRVLEVARSAASAVPLGFLGVDIVVDHEAEPRVLELNARPGLEIQNVNGECLPDAADLAPGEEP